MKAVDTNVLARFFVDDPDDPESVKQRPTAVAALSEPVSVSGTVLLEFEWVCAVLTRYREKPQLRSFGRWRG